TRADMETLARNRRIFINAIERAADLGHLWFADTEEVRAWVVTDSRRIVAESRRLDGNPWAGKGKTWTTIKEFGDGCWPVGAASIGDCPNILLCEGTPDFICAHECDEAAPVAMLGGGMNIHPD